MQEMEALARMYQKRELQMLAAKRCDKIARCDDALMKSKFKDVEQCGEAITEVYFSRSFCPDYSIDNARQCEKEMAALDCPAFLSVLAEKTGPPESCDRICPAGTLSHAMAG